MFADAIYVDTSSMPSVMINGSTASVKNKNWNQKESQYLIPCMAYRFYESASYAAM